MRIPKHPKYPFIIFSYLKLYYFILFYQQKDGYEEDATVLRKHLISQREATLAGTSVSPAKYRLPAVPRQHALPTKDSLLMKIGFFAPSLYMPDVGGAEIFLDRLILSLQRRGHTVALVAPRRRGSTHRLAYPTVRCLRPFSKRFVQHALPPLLLAHARFRFDLLHCQGEFQPAWTARTFQRLAGIPYVVRATGGGFETASQHPRVRHCVEHGLAAAERVVAQGKYLFGCIRGCGVPAGRIVTINNGVVPEEVLTPARPSPYDRPFLLFTGGLRRVKGYDVLLDAFARIRDQVHPVRLVLAGCDQEHADFARRLAAFGLSDEDVYYAGLLDRAGIAAHLQHALAYVCPFRRSPFSNATLEAMAAGCPLVVTTVDGNLEQVRIWPEDGLRVPPENSAALAAALLTLCKDPARREALAQAAKRRAADFSWERMVDQYENLYREVADRRA